MMRLTHGPPQATDLVVLSQQVLLIVGASPTST